MLNEERVKLMTKMAIYENKHGKEDFKISTYYRKDYASLHTIYTMLSVTLGFFLLLALLIVVNLELLLDTMSIPIMIIMGLAILTSYILMIIVYGVFANDYYQKRHQEARHRVKKFNRDLTKLNKMYEKEK